MSALHPSLQSPRPSSFRCISVACSNLLLVAIKVNALCNRLILEPRFRQSFQPKLYSLLVSSTLQTCSIFADLSDVLLALIFKILLLEHITIFCIRVPNAFWDNLVVSKDLKPVKNLDWTKSERYPRTLQAMTKKELKLWFLFSVRN